MRRLYFCAPERPVYRAGACAITCFDARFEVCTRKFLRRLAGEWIDHLKLAGGVKALASPQDEAEREFLVRQVRASIRLHDPPRLLLLSHADCGAYGGRELFDGDEQREIEFHRAELCRAALLLRGLFPELPVECFYLNFDGAWDVEDRTPEY